MPYGQKTNFATIELSAVFGEVICPSSSCLSDFDSGLSGNCVGLGQIGHPTISPGLWTYVMANLVVVMHAVCCIIQQLKRW